MATKNTARDILWPTDTNIVLRVCFLYVGQGSSILVLVRDDDTYRAVLVDVNLDKKNGGIDVPTLVDDLLTDGKLHAFINTHPHDDHLHGLKELAEKVTIERVWHTGFDPGKKKGGHFTELQDLIDDVTEREGAEAVVRMRGSTESTPLFDAEVFTLAPADFVKDEIDEEDADARYARIHEYCAVLRFGKGESWVLVTGDADLVAFRDYIASYHEERLPSFVLDAPHHGSRSFFKEKEGDEPYLDALETTAPDYVVMSAPTTEESQFDHPHEEAVDLYAAEVGSENVLHTGEDRKCYWFDIHDDGSHSGPSNDEGKLTEKYALDRDDDDDDGGNGGGSKAKGPFERPSEPSRPEPRKYA